jgi:hypothetical protein
LRDDLLASGGSSPNQEEALSTKGAMTTIILPEDMVGRVGATDSIAYPNLKCCLGVTCVLDSGVLWGAHVPRTVDDYTLLPLLTWLRSREPDDSTHFIQDAYITGNIEMHASNAKLLPDQVAQQKLFFLGFTEKTRIHTMQIAYDPKTNQAGTFVKLTSHRTKSGWECAIEYKRDAKMQYPNTPYDHDQHEQFCLTIFKRGGFTGSSSLTRPTSITGDALRKGAGPLKLHTPGLFRHASVKTKTLEPKNFLDKSTDMNLAPVRDLRVNPKSTKVIPWPPAL